MNVRTGMGLAGAAYVMWGLFPAFFKLLRHVDPLRVLAHRAWWAGVLALFIIGAFRRAAWRAWWSQPDRNAQLRVLLLTAALLGSNWGVYIHAVTSNQLVEASLGYFICPLVTVGLGVAFAGERPNRAQWAGITLAALGVLQLAVRGATVPWLALYLAASFAAYGMLRKRLALDPLLASSLEASWMAPVALGYLLIMRPEPLVEMNGTGALLCTSGVITAVPLMLYAAGAKRLPYLTLGLLQYMTPILQLVLAVVVYREPLTRPQLFAFVLIWSALLCSSLAAGWRALVARKQNWHIVANEMLTSATRAAPASADRSKSRGTSLAA